MRVRSGGRWGLPLLSPAERLVLAVVVLITLAAHLWGWWQSPRAPSLPAEQKPPALPTEVDPKARESSQPAEAAGVGRDAEEADTDGRIPAVDADPEPAPLAAAPTDAVGKAGPDVASSGPPPASSSPSTPISLNGADAAELEALPGIGPALARRIVEYREQHGPFQSVDELQEVPGIGEARLRELRSWVTVP
ncbi:MAG: helix-hairpin-helix domain-containing protein [Limnochordales bacterium]|nr:helix-hairpin-helix domain-containing protein [Limnochordales bacterium]